jgi:hypothetical protein
MNWSVPVGGLVGAVLFFFIVSAIQKTWPFGVKGRRSSPPPPPVDAGSVKPCADGSNRHQDSAD